MQAEQSVGRGAADRVVSEANVDWRRPGQRCRSSGPTPDANARLFPWPHSAEHEPPCGLLTPTELRPLASATVTGSTQSESIPRILTDCSDELIARTNGLLGRIDCSDELCLVELCSVECRRFVRSSEIDYDSRIGGPREAATNEQNRTNNRLHPRSRFSAIEVVDRPRDRGESRRSSAHDSNA